MGDLIAHSVEEYLMIITLRKIIKWLLCPYCRHLSKMVKKKASFYRGLPRIVDGFKRINFYLYPLHCLLVRSHRIHRLQTHYQFHLEGQDFQNSFTAILHVFNVSYPRREDSLWTGNVWKQGQRHQANQEKLPNLHAYPPLKRKKKSPSRPKTREALKRLLLVVSLTVDEKPVLVNLWKHVQPIHMTAVFHQDSSASVKDYVSGQLLHLEVSG